MLYCNSCGQSIFINDDTFLAYVDVNSSQAVYIDPTTGRISDYGEVGDLNDTGDTYEYSCPYCESENIELEWDGTEQEALKNRLRYIKEMDEESDETDAIFQERLNLLLGLDKEWD